jgi:tetratricopeptide (TPR) repeat protein
LLSFAQQVSSQSHLAQAVEPYRAVALAGKGQEQQAREAFSTFLKTASPDRLGMAVQLFRASFGDVDAFAREAASWIQQRPDEPVLLASVAQQLLQSGATQHYQTAKAYAQQAAQAAKNNRVRADAYILLGQLCYNLQEYEDSAEAYRRGLQEAPGDVPALNNLAYVYAEQLGKPDQALPYARRAARLMPDNARILDTYGWTLAQAGQYTEAIEPMSRAVELAPDEAKALLLYHQGFVYEKLRQWPNAKRAYERALAQEIIADTVKNNASQGLKRVSAQVDAQ